MTLFWKYAPVEHSVSLGYPSPKPADPLGPALLAIVLTPSLIALLGKELARKGAKPARARVPFGTPGPETGFFLPLFLPFFRVSFFPKHIFQVDSAAERTKTWWGFGQDCGGETV